MRIALPRDVEFIIHTLQEAGFDAYAVGGCVRDSLLGREPNDWDITTSAKPEETKALFARTIDTGIQHGTVTVMLHRNGYEVTTYRVDGEYEDSRHPREVTFTVDLTEDLKRRDFTINAMAYNHERGLVDVFGGAEDLEQGIVRCVGIAEERFDEDALRIMRAVRFAAQLGFVIEERTRAAIKTFAPRLTKVSAERIQVELTKLLESPNPEYLRIAWETGITAVILPEFDRLMGLAQNNPHHRYDVGEHTLHTLQIGKSRDQQIESGRRETPEDSGDRQIQSRLSEEALTAQNLKYLRLAALFHDFGKAETRTTDENGCDHFYGHAAVSEELAVQILRRLRYDNDTIDHVRLLVRWHDQEILPEKRAVRRAVSRIGTEHFLPLLRLKQADLDAQSDHQKEEKQEHLNQLYAIFLEIRRDGDCLAIKDLAVNGRDLIRAGVSPGPDMGRILKEMLEDVLENPEHNTREYLLRFDS